MGSLLGYANSTDSTQGNFIAILVCAGGIICVCVMAGIVIAVARRRGHRNAEMIFTAMFFWGVVSLGSIVYATVTQMKWAHDHLLDLESGYGNPADVGPGWPWVLWVGLAVVYVGVLGWVVMARKS